MHIIYTDTWYAVHTHTVYGIQYHRAYYIINMCSHGGSAYLYRSTAGESMCPLAPRRASDSVLTLITTGARIWVSIGTYRNRKYATVFIVIITIIIFFISEFVCLYRFFSLYLSFHTTVVSYNLQVDPTHAHTHT